MLPEISACGFFADRAVAIAGKKRFQRGNPAHVFFSEVGFFDQNAVGLRFHNAGFGKRLGNRIRRCPLEGPMLREGQSVGIVDQRIAGDPGRRLIGFRDAAVDDEELSAAFYGAFALAYRDVTVDDMGGSGIEPEIAQDRGDGLLLLVIRVVLHRER